MLICISALGFGARFWNSQLYALANGLFAVGSFFGALAIIWCLWCGWMFWGAPRLHARRRKKRVEERQREAASIQANRKVVELYYDPDPTSDFIHIMVENNGPTDRFVADLEEMRGAELPLKTPWGVKWRSQQHKEDRLIVSGHKGLLDLCEAFAPTTGPAVGSTQRGWFKFYSTSEPTGFPVKAGPQDALIPDGTAAELEEALSQHSHYDEHLVLKVRVSGIESNNSVTKRVRLGFKQPLKKTYDGETLVVERVKERFLVEIDDWPTDSPPSPESTPGRASPQPPQAP